MPTAKTIEHARRLLRQGKSPSTAAGVFIREEIEHVKEGRHGNASRKQAIAMGLAQARRAGVPLPPPPWERSASGRRRATSMARAAAEGKARKARKSVKARSAKASGTKAARAKRR